MALTATIYNFATQLSDIDRGVYETLDLRMARQPSETVENMLMRFHRGSEVPIYAFEPSFVSEVADALARRVDVALSITVQRHGPTGIGGVGERGHRTQHDFLEASAALGVQDQIAGGIVAVVDDANRIARAKRQVGSM